jgi:hypothetical protein
MLITPFNVIIASDHCSRILFRERNSVVDEFYERTAGLIFEKEEENEEVEARCWSILDLDRYRTQDTALTQTATISTTLEAATTDLSKPAQLATIDLEIVQLARFIQVGHIT